MEEPLVDMENVIMSSTSDQLQPEKARPDEPLPEQIGRYRILERLGAGGMGAVYKAQDRQLNRLVALKLPRFDGPQQELAKRVQRFQREARVAAQIWHPQVCPIYDVGDHDGQPYVVMAYVAGQSLAKRLDRHGRFDNVGEAVTVTRQILDGLEAVHAHGIIHRDLKPSNILMDQSSHAILVDFGLARPEYDGDHLTSDGVIVGTPAYMAPEQAVGQSEHLGLWTDLYSVGVVLYQMLTGRLPFEGPPLTILSRIVHEAPPPPSSLRPDIDPALEALVLRALAKEPTERYLSARQFAEALEGWVQSNSGKATPQVEESARRSQVVSQAIPTPILLGGHAQLQYTIGVSLTAALILLASFLPWGEEGEYGPFTLGKRSVQRYENPTRTATAWNSYVSLQGIKVPTYLVVVAAAGVALVSWLRALSVWRGPAVLPLGLGVYGLAYAGWLILFVVVSDPDRDSAGVGSVLTAIAFFVMLIVMFKQIRSQQTRKA
jgi:serine/threonine protein kinase